MKNIFRSFQIFEREKWKLKKKKKIKNEKSGSI
jgi:hypothetical protein